MRILGPLAVSAFVLLSLAGCAATAGDAAPAVGTSSAPSPTPSATVDSAPTQCTDANLTIALTGGDFDAGVIYYELEFKNVGTQPCTLAGYPQAWVSDGTSQLGAAALESDPYPTETFTLAPNDFVSSSFSVVDNSSLPEAADDGCSVVNGSGYEVTAPGETVGQYIEVGVVPACTHDGATWMTVTAVH